MDEQGKKLNALGCCATVLHAGIDGKKQYAQLLALYNGDMPEFLFLSPERLATDGFLEFVLHHVREKIHLVVVDEAHCISQWGLDFRPFYKEIPPFLSYVFQDAQRPLLLGLTATLSPKDVEQMCADFSIATTDVLRSTSLLRHDIALNVRKVGSEEEKDELLWRHLEDYRDEKVLVYVDRRSGKRSTEELSIQAKERGHAADYFHAGLSSEAKMAVIERLVSGELRLVFATNAFGMGIDIPDIRGVIHYLLPESVEQYYQQIGRAGRDRKPAGALLFYSDKNIQVRKKDFIGKSFPEADDIRKGFGVLSNGKAGKVTFDLFGQDGNVQAAFHHLTRCAAVRVECKAVQNVNIFDVAKGQKLPEFDAMRDATKSGLFLRTAQKLGLSEHDVAQKLYLWLAQGKIKAQNSPAKCLVIESQTAELPEATLESILGHIETVKAYKFSVFDDFVRLLNEFTDSTKLHQEVGLYLGVDKFSLGKIYQTLSGDMVRSKSEVIIANMLFERKIPFRYEQTLRVDGKTYSPDFTIEWQGKTFFWEHLGRLDDTTYADDWRRKKPCSTRTMPASS